jgi:hypothetical protein
MAPDSMHAAADRPGADASRRATLLVLLLFAFLLVYFRGVFALWANPNELSRFEAVIAMGEWNTFSIDRAIELLGDHEDKSVSNGRYYSNKAPGLAFAAYPVYRLLRLVFPIPSFATSNTIFWVMRLLTVSFVCLLALWRFSRRVAEAPSPPWVAPLLTLAVATGTTFLFYSRSFFSHAWTASLLFLAWDLIRVSETPSRSPGGARRERLAAAGAGLLAALAAISEYTVAPIAVLIGLRMLAGRSAVRVAAFGLAALLPLGALLLYNQVCFGSPFTLSSALEADPAYARLVEQGSFGFQVPSPRYFAYYLFHPARGVLLFSPFLLWAIPGAVRWWRSRERRADWWFFVGGTLLLLVVMSGYPNWHGGWALGSRYLIPGVFLAAMPVAWALHTPLSRGLFLAATTYSMASHLVMTSSCVYFPKELPWPSATGSLWLLQRGWFADNLGMDAGLPGWLSVLLPAALVIALLLRVARPIAPIRPALPVAMLLGIAPLAGLLLRPPEPPYLGRLWRAAVLGAFTDRDVQRQELLLVAAEASTPAERSLAYRMWRAYGPPPPAEGQAPKAP